MRWSCLYLLSQLFKVFFICFSLKMQKNIWEISFFWKNLFNTVDFSFHVKQLLLNRLFFWNQSKDIFLDFCDFDINIFFHIKKDFFLNCFAEIFDFVANILNLLISWGNLMVYFLLEIFKFFISLNLLEIYFLLYASELPIEILYRLV